jgi:hypothetical protein
MYVVIKSLFAPIAIIASFLIALLYLNNSWIKIVILGLIVVSSVVWFVSRGLLRRVFKYVVVGVLIFALSFSAFEGYMFRHSTSYPPTFDSQPGVTLSYPNILNVSLTEIVHDVKNTHDFKIFTSKYPNEFLISHITLSTITAGGSIYITFYQEPTHVFLSFNAGGGGPYHVNGGSSGDMMFWSKFTQSQEQDAVLKQMDTLGLQWYYDRAVEAYQNKTGIDSEVDELTITIFATHPSYPETQIQITGLHKEDGQNSRFAFNAFFQPNGTLDYISTPR